MHANQVVDMHADLLHRASSNEKFRRVVLNHMMVASESEENAKMTLLGVKTHLGAAYPYLVTPDMCELVSFSSMGLDADDKFDRSLAPTQCGIVRFDKPLTVTDVRGRNMKVHWMTWGPASSTRTSAIGGPARTNPAVMVSLWNDMDDADDVAQEIIDTIESGHSEPHHVDYLRQMGRWSFIGAFVTEDGEPLKGTHEEIPEEFAQRIIEEGDVPHAFTNTVRYVHALWLMLGQTIAATSHQSATKKRSVRSAKTMNIPDRVTVIDLRRVEGVDREPGESAVEWRHRWLVRGHWRWQACGEGRKERQRIWIAPHVRGPDGLPLKVSSKVYSLRR